VWINTKEATGHDRKRWLPEILRSKNLGIVLVSDVFPVILTPSRGCHATRQRRARLQELVEIADE
jgi:hypothetical protein